MASIPASEKAESVEQKFQRLAALWRAETAHLSSTTRMFNHPAYQEIIALGAPVMARSAANQWSGSRSRSRSRHGTTSAPMPIIS